MIVHAATDPDTTFAATDGRMREHYLEMVETRRLRSARERLLGAGNRVAVRPTQHEEAGIVRVDARVTIARAPDVNDLPSYEVRVYSLMRPGAYKRVTVGERPTERLVGAAAGACCEALCEGFRDPFDPSQAARAAVGCLRSLVDAA